MTMSQTLGTFSSNGIQFNITSNGIEFNDGIIEGSVKELGSLSKNQFEEIPQDMIEEAKRLSIESGVTMLIYDFSDKESLPRYKYIDTERSRDYKVDSILGAKFYIDSWYHLMDMPSRNNYYDTVTDSVSNVERHRKVYEFLYSIDFIKRDYLHDWLNVAYTNDTKIKYKEYFDRVMNDPFNIECSFRNEFCPNIILRVKPNLLIEISILTTESIKNHTFFYDPNQILNIVTENSSVEYKRELKIKNLIS